MLKRLHPFLFVIWIIVSPKLASAQSGPPLDAIPAPGIPANQEPGLITKRQANFFDLMAVANNGELKHLHDYKGQVVLVVNTASRCGYTPQYRGLQSLQEKFKNQKFTVLAFPSNDFGKQEPGTDAEIKSFCETEFKISFPLFKKDAVTGEKKQPVFKFLTQQGPKSTQGEVKWNFEKFLIDRNGQLVARFPSATEPTDASLIKEIEAQLSKPVPASQKK